MNANIIGIEENIATNIVSKLNVLLSDYQIYYQNLRGFHWNIQGKRFFSLHEKFEELYTHTAQTIDDIAERILTLGSTPLHSFEDYLTNAHIKAEKNVHDAELAAQIVIQNLNHLLKHQREVIKIAAEGGDEGTVGLISELTTIQEKNIWMFNAWLK
ncbi:MAG: DNA starvation/stationary phase protection protein [Bacteroidota bacterium]|nr:DNA starvation/stationary phase protection protein [Bacteroidota bacterium]